MSRAERPEEKACAASLDAHLRSLGEVDFHLGFNPDDPPDYWLDLAGVRYAVEVTQITDQGLRAHWDRCHKLHAALCGRCQAENLLDGRYELDIYQQPPLPRLRSREGADLLDKCVLALRFLAKSPEVKVETLIPGAECAVVTLTPRSGGKLLTVTVEDSGQSVTLLSGPEGQLRLAKVFGQGSRLDLSTPHTGFIHVPLELIRERIEEKREALETKGVLQRCPRVILALHDTYGLAEKAHKIRRALSGVELPGWVHSIYWDAMFPGSPGEEDAFVFSRNPCWC